MSSRFSKTDFSLSSFLIVIVISTVCSAQWLPQNSGTTQSLRSVHFLDSQTGFCAGYAGVILKTTNGGANWLGLNSGTSNNLNSIYVFSLTDAIACGNSGLVIKTTNSGLNWSPVNSGYTSNLFAISFRGTNGICPGSGGHIWTSDGGNTWNIGQSGFIVTYYGAYMVTPMIGYIAGVNTIFSPLFGKTTNGGMNWTYSSFYVNSNEATLRGVYFLDINTGFAVSTLWNGQGGISLTSNGGANWTHQLFTSSLTGVDFASPSVGYTVGGNGSIMKTTEGGVTWNSQTSNTSVVLWAIDFTDSLTGWAVGDNGTILKTTTGGITAIKGTSETVPSSFRLYQNYPNPFNPVTKIKFDIPPVASNRSARSPSDWADIRLTIHDLLGKEISILLSQPLSPGSYEISWDGSAFPSAIYFYRLEVNGMTFTKTMSLIK
jgi:photosystem II stability/assembly factor-like uncharacterized protein